MPVCRAYQISHDEFLRWSQGSRDKAIWWEIRLNRVCQSCGTRPEEWDEEQDGRMHAYTHEPHHCRGCEVKAQGDDWLEHHRKALRRGTTIRLVPIPKG